MRVVALISGGKDSTFNMMQCVAAGHQIVALAYLEPHSKTEMDSYMYQSVGHEAIDLISSAMDLPLFKRTTYGKSTQIGRTYEPTEGDEVEDMVALLKDVKDTISGGFDAVSVGAIFSDYQRVRVENVCTRLGLTSLAFLWRRDQHDLLDEMIRCEVDAVLIKVAALGLEAKHLGRSLSLMQPVLLSMSKTHGLNVCGEGGEYETLTLDCPLFSSRIVIVQSEVITLSDNPIAPVAFLKFNKLSLELKLPPLDLQTRLKGLPLYDSNYYVQIEEDILEELDEIQEILECPIGATSSKNRRVSSDVSRQIVGGTKSDHGWLWIGGIQGRSNTPTDAMKEALQTLKCLLDEKGHSPRDVCSITLYVGDMSKFALINKEYVETFNFAEPPSRACVEVPLGESPFVVMEVASWREPREGSGDLLMDRRAVHVQSRSHWAPSNIGPYSQAVRVGPFIHLAGQIGLVPGTLELIEGGIISQARLALRHIARVLSCAHSTGLNLRDAVQGVCYLIDEAHVEPMRKLWEAHSNDAVVEYVVVSNLPRNALVEWHFWAHAHNNRFEYEERGKQLKNFAINSYRRASPEGDVAAIICHLERVSQNNDTHPDDDILKEMVGYALEKLGIRNERCPALNLKVFFDTESVSGEALAAFFQNYKTDNSLAYTLVPTYCIKHGRILMSICGIRYG